MKNRKVYAVLALALFIVALLVASFVSPPEQPKAKADWAGICVHSLSADDARLINESGAGWIRIDCSDTLSNFNQSVRNAKAYNLSVLGILDSWMFGQSCEFTLEAWSSNVTHYVSQYADYVDAWEIWNEPTSPNLGWQLQVDYLSMVQIASQIIREYDNTSKIVLFGGLQLYTGGSDYVESDKAFAGNLSSLNITQYGDAISVHAYPWGKEAIAPVWDSYTTSLSYYQGLLGNQSIEIWVTETGQNITASSEAEQAQYMTNSLDYFNGKVDKVFWYALHDDEMSDFGLIENDVAARPSYCAMQKALNP